MGDRARVRELAVIALAALACAVAPAAADIEGADDAEYVEDGETTEDIENWDEVILDGLSGDEDPDAFALGLDALLREAAAFRANPLDLNVAPLASLARVPLLSSAAAVRIVESRRIKGPFGSPDELVARGCLTANELLAVRPYVRVITVPPRSAGLDPASGLEPASESVAASSPGGGLGVLTWSARLRVGLREQYGASWPSGGVSRVASLAGVRAEYGNGLALGMTCEKDPGEESLLDHSVWALEWRPRNNAGGAPLAACGLGHFSGRWGQGLVLGGAGFSAAGSYPLETDRLRSYLGSGEARARSGAFLELSRGPALVTAVAAYTRLDAARDEAGSVTSIRSSGYHRTPGEREGAETLEESLLGVRARVARGSRFESALSLLHFAFSPRLNLADLERKRFGYRGDELTVAGCDLRFETGAARAGAEVAVTSTGAFAGLGAVRCAVGGVRVRAGGACLSRDYWNPLGGAVPGFSGGSNGTAAWLSLAYTSRQGWRAWANARVAGRAWRSYNLEMPDWRTTAAFGVEVKAGASSRLSAEVRSSTRVVDASDEPRTRQRDDRRYRLSIVSGGAMPTTLSLLLSESRTEGVRVGSLRAASVRASWDAVEIASIDAGVTAVSVWGSPQSHMQYEPRLPGEFSLRSLNASGARWYIRVQRGLPAGLVLTGMVAGGPARGATELGICIEAGG